MSENVNADDRLQGLVAPERLARWMDERDLRGKGLPITCRFVTGTTRLAR